MPNVAVDPDTESYSMEINRQEYPSFCTTDFGTQAYEIVQPNGSRISNFVYKSHEIFNGKTGIKDLPATYADESEAMTLEIIFDEMGVDYPDDTWTWADFADAAAKLTNDEHWGYAIQPGNNQEGFYNTIYSMGGYVISDDKKTSGFDDPKTIEAIKLYTDMIAAGSCPDLNTVSETAPNELLCAGKSAMCISGSWMLAGYRDNEYSAANCDVAVLPYTNDPSDRVSIYNGLGWAAAANGKNTDAAWSLIEYLGTKEAQIKQAELGVTMAAYEGCSDSWVNSVECFDLNGHMKMLDAKLVFRPYSRNTVVWEDMMTEKLKDAWTGEKSAEDVCHDIAAEMNEALAEE